MGHSDETISPGPNVAVPTALLDLFSTLTAALGQRREAPAIRRACEHALHGLATSWPVRLRAIAGQLGLRLSPVTLPVREALHFVSKRTPLVALLPGAPDATLILLRESNGSRARVTIFTPHGSREDRLKINELEKMLAESPAAPLEWFSCQPAAPLEEARSIHHMQSAHAAPGAPHTHDAAEHAHGASGGHAGGHAHLPPLRRLMLILWPERRDLRMIFIFAVALGVLGLTVPVAVQSLVNTVAFGGLLQPLFILGILLAAFLLLDGSIRLLNTYVVEIIQRRLFIRVVADLAWRLPRVRVDAFDRGHGPELVNRFFDVLTLQKAGAALMLDGLALVLQVFIGLVLLALYHPYLLVFALIMLLVIAVVIFVVGRGAVRTAIQESVAKYSVAASLEEIARNPTTFKHNGGTRFAQERADTLAFRYLTARRAHFNIVIRQIIGMVALFVLASTALLTIGGWLVIDGQLTLGQLVASELIVSTLLASLVKSGKHFDSFYDLLASVDKIGHLIDLPLERTAGETLAASSVGARLILRDVDFSYDPERPILKHVNLRVDPGERVAIVGRNGAGKSTIGDLVNGLRMPDHGHLEIDGIDLRNVQLEALREQVALIRGLEIIEGDILENVRMRRPEVSSACARQALTDVGLLDELLALPDGLETVLSATGSPLSFGQARRLMLARALATRPRLVVLDGVLDDLDEASLQQVKRALYAADAPWSVLILTCVPEAVRGCDRIIPLVEGRLGPTDLNGLLPILNGAGLEPVEEPA